MKEGSHLSKVNWGSGAGVAYLVGVPRVSDVMGEDAVGRRYGYVEYLGCAGRCGDEECH